MPTLRWRAAGGGRSENALTGRITMSHHAQEKSNLKVGLVGLGVGLVWIAIVATISHFLAL